MHRTQAPSHIFKTTGFLLYGLRGCDVVSVATFDFRLSLEPPFLPACSSFFSTVAVRPDQTKVSRLQNKNNGLVA